MKHKQRNSESNLPQVLVDYTQNGILIRFNEIEVQKEESISYQCTEFWFPLNSTIDEIESIVKEKGFELTDKHKDLIK